MQKNINSREDYWYQTRLININGRTLSLGGSINHMTVIELCRHQVAVRLAVL